MILILGFLFGETKAICNFSHIQNALLFIWRYFIPFKTGCDDCRF